MRLILRQFFFIIAVLRQSMCKSQPFLVILCATLLSRSKLIFFTFESADIRIFLYVRDASFSCKMLLKLIHFKSFKEEMTWSRFKYFPCIVCHFCGKTATFLYLKQQLKVKSSMARSLQVVNLLPQNVCSIINYLQ